MMGNAVTTRLADQFNMNLSDVQSIDIIVSFIQESGYREIEGLIQEAKNNEIPVRIITSTYMNITNPTALTLLFFAPQNVKTYIYSGSAPSFHPKAYFFNYKQECRSIMFVGSSNLSKPALTNGVEWNYRIQAKDDQEAFKAYKFEFELILIEQTMELTREILEDYRKIYQYNRDALKDVFRKHYKPKPNIEENVMKVASPNIYKIKEQVEQLYKPNAAQTEALLELQGTRDEGNEKAMVVAATGVGKTFLAAFDSKAYDRILFIAHREEILNQAYNTFAKIRDVDTLGRFYNGHKDLDKEIVFASVQTLSRADNLANFDKKYFQYICVDELHHGVANTYEKIINYFEPEFLLGLTATPHRLDRKDVFAICDYNSVYEVDLFMSINRGWLVPYKYYGIYDATVNYENVRYMNGKYVEKELEKALMIHQRAELVLKHFKRYQRKRALAFCSNINHSEFMADYFAKNGVKSICIHSDAQRKYYCERNIGIQKLEAGDVDVVFSVDMLSEGVDIKTLDLLLFLRPTESPVVFLQQIGRGLRIAEGKQDVRILDFIGNYKKVDLIPFLLGKKQENTRDIIKDLQEGKNLPLDCQVDFEFEAIDLIRSILKSRQKIDALIEEWFLQCQEESETYQIPTRMEFFNWLDDEQYQLMKRHKKHNPFKDYCRYISHRNNSSIERVFLDTNEYHFIQCIENTKMSQLYKIPVIQTFIQSGEMRNRVSIDEIVDSFIVFYSNNRNRLDILRNKSTGEPNAFTREQWKRLIINNPIKFLSKTHGDIFERVEDTFRIKLEFKQKEYRQWFVKNVQDVLDFRRNEFLDQRIEKK